MMTKIQLNITHIQTKGIKWESFDKSNSPKKWTMPKKARNAVTAASTTHTHTFKQPQPLITSFCVFRCAERDLRWLDYVSFGASKALAHIVHGIFEWSRNDILTKCSSHECILSKQLPSVICALRRILNANLIKPMVNSQKKNSTRDFIRSCGKMSWSCLPILSYYVLDAIRDAYVCINVRQSLLCDKNPKCASTRYAHYTNYKNWDEKKKDDEEKDEEGRE